MMVRLTEHDEFGNADIIGVGSEGLQDNLMFDEFNLVTAALNRLAAYEDTGLTPEEVARLKVTYGRCMDCPMVCVKESYLVMLNENRALKAENSALSAQLDRPKNKPLTLDELREMEMQPVYVVFLHDGDGEWRIPLLFDSGHCSTDYPAESIRFTDKSAEPISDYGITWLAYRHEPTQE